MHDFVLWTQDRHPLLASQSAGAQALGFEEGRGGRGRSLWNSDQRLPGHSAAPGRACGAIHALHSRQGLHFASSFVLPASSVDLCLPQPGQTQHDHQPMCPSLQILAQLDLHADSAQLTNEFLQKAGSLTSLLPPRHKIAGAEVLFKEISPETEDYLRQR